MSGSGAAPPKAPRRPHPTELFGERREDDYFWLRERGDPEVTAYLEAENRYAEGWLAPTAAFQETLYAEMLGRVKQTDLSVPYREGNYFYYHRTEEGKQYPVHCRKAGSLDAPEEILLDLNLLAEGKPYLGIGVLDVSDDGSRMAYSLDTTGFREFDLFVMEIATRQVLAGPIPHTGSVAWAAGNDTLFYAIENDAKRYHQIWRLSLGGAPEPVFEEPDERFRVAVQRTRSRRHILLQLESHTTSELHLLDPSVPARPPRLFLPRLQDRELQADHLGDGWVLRVNDAGPNFRLVRMAEGREGGMAEWEEVIPHRDDVMLEQVDAFRGHFVVMERREGLVRFVLHPRTGPPRAVSFPEPVYEAYPGGNPEWETSRFRYGYESPVTPSSVYEYDLGTGESELLKRREVLGGYDPERYGCERVTVPAADGVGIPVSLVFGRKDGKTEGRKEGKTEGRTVGPVLLTGYGAYGISYPVGFSSNRLSLLDRGVTVAIAHVRGGGELGRRWHDGGRMAHKMNSFTDFIAVGEWLVREGYTTPALLAIEGGSAGGLLMGAVTNLRPDLFGTVISQVPFVDVINTMLDASLPLTVGEYEEWGNPQVEEQYRWMRAYCPYSNLHGGRYPGMLVRTSLNDSQVMYWEPAKYVARLRTLAEAGEPRLLLTNMGAGHSGASGRYDRLREIALDYAFLLWRVGRWAP